MNFNEKQLIERSQHGDREALDLLLTSHYKKAYLFALSMTRHPDEAEDLVSEGFVRIINAIGRFRSESSFQAWVCRILKNCFLDIRKRRRVTIVGSLDSLIEGEDWELTAQPDDGAEPVDDTVIRKEMIWRVQALYDQIPEAHSKMIRLYYTEQLTYDEIAVLTKTPCGTVKSRLNRARMNLEELIRRDGNLMSFIVG